MSEGRCKTAILISGSGSNLQSFIDRVAGGELSLELSVVFSNQLDAIGLSRAWNAGIDTACIDHDDYETREEFDRTLAAKLDRAADPGEQMRAALRAAAT